MGEWRRPKARWIAAAWGAAAAVLCWPAVAGAPREHDLTAIVLASDEGPTYVALSYPEVIDHQAVADGIRQLAEQTGASVGQVEITDSQQAQGMPGEGTAAQFTAEGLVRVRTGALPVGPIIRSLPHWSRMRLVFIMGDDFPFVGPGDTAADGFVLQLVNRMKPYEYDVERKSGGAAPEQEMVEEELGLGALLPAALIGLPAGLIVGWLLGDVRPGQHARTGGKR
jgi:hypothetical protein